MRAIVVTARIEEKRPVIFHQFDARLTKPRAIFRTHLLCALRVQD